LSLKKSGEEKLKPHFYSPYKVIRRVGEVAYEMEVLEGSRIHNTFHVSCLNKELGQQVIASTDLPPLDEEGQLVLTPYSIVDVREWRLILFEITWLYGEDFLQKMLPMKGSRSCNTLIWNCLRKNNLRKGGL
jgi:hypothetical protein